MKKIILLFLLFLSSCSNEYLDFHSEKNIQIEENKNIENELENFSFEKIKYLTWVTIKETPSLDLLSEMTQEIDNAKTRVYVEVYIFTEKRLKKSIIDAKNRWVDVKVILEKNVYWAPYLNNDIYKIFKNAWIDVKYSNAENYSLNHTKMMIVDNKAIISTWNYSYSSFKYNREFFIFIKNSEIFEKLLSIYETDFLWIKKNIYHDNLVLSPFSSREKLEYLLKNATKSIKIYAHNFSDENIEKIILQKSKENISVKMIFPDLKKVSSNKDEIEKLKDWNIETKIIDKPEIHAKSILIDEKYLYLWSINFSEYSIDKNREIWIFLSNEDLIKYFLKIFEWDFKENF